MQQAKQRSAAVVLGLVGALVAASCVESPEAMPETAAPSAPVDEVAEPESTANRSAAWKARYDIDDRLDAILPRWSVYTIQNAVNVSVFGAGCQEHTFVDGWIYLTNAWDWDQHCRLVAVPKGALGDPSRWVKLSMVELSNKGPHDYFTGLLEGGLPLADLLGITLALAESEDEVPALPEPLGSGQGRIEEGSGGTYFPSLPPEWWYGDWLPARGSDKGGKMRYPQPVSHDGAGLQVPGRYSGEPEPPRGWRGAPPPRPLWPYDNTPAKGQWETSLASFFNQVLDKLEDPAAAYGPVDTFLSSPVGDALCKPSAVSRVSEQLTMFPEVAGFVAVCDSVKIRPRIYSAALADVRAFLKQVGSFVSGMVYGVRTYYPQCHIVPYGEIEYCCRTAADYWGPNYPEGVCPNLPPDKLKKFVDYEICRTDSEQAQWR